MAKRRKRLDCVVFFDTVEEGEGLIKGGGGDKGQSEGLEVEESTEVVAVVFAHFEDGRALAFEVDGSQQMATAHIDALGHSDVPFGEPLEGALALFEDPWVADGGTADEDAVDAVTYLAINGLRCCGDVAIAEDGNMDSGVILHGANHGPVGSAAIHLILSASVDAQGSDTGVL